MKKIYTLILPLLCMQTALAQPEILRATPILFGGGGQSSFQSQTQGSMGSSQTVTTTTQSQATTQSPQVRSQSSQMRVPAPAARTSQQYVAVANPQIVTGVPQQVVTAIPQQVVRVAPVSTVGGIGDRKLFIDNLYNKIQLAKQAPHAPSQGRYGQLAQDSVVYDLLREHPDLLVGSLVFQPVNNTLPNAADLRRGQDFYRRKFGNKDYTLREITSLIDQDIYNVNNTLNDDWIMLADALQLTRDANSDRPSIMGDLLSEYILLGKIKILEGRPNLTPQEQTLLVSLYDDLYRVYQELPQNQAVLATSDLMLVQPIAQEYMAVQTVTTPNGTMQTGQTDQTTTTVQTNTTGTTAGAGGGGGGYVPPAPPPPPAPAPRRYRSASGGGSSSTSSAAAVAAPAPAPAPAPSVDTAGITNSILAGIGNLTAGLGGGGGGGGGYNNYDGGGNTNYGGGGSNQNDSPNTNSMAPVNITVQGASITGGSVGDTTGGSAAGGTGGSANTRGGDGAGGSGGSGGSANTRGGDGAGGTGGGASGGTGGSANTTSGSATGATGGTANTQGGNIKTKGGNVKGGNVKGGNANANANADAKANGNVRIGKHGRNKNTPGNNPPVNTPPGNTPPITATKEKCPKGQRMEGGTCVPKPPRDCPKGQKMEGGKCVTKQNKCKIGVRLEDGTCEVTATSQKVPIKTTTTPETPR